MKISIIFSLICTNISGFILNKNLLNFKVKPTKFSNLIESENDNIPIRVMDKKIKDFSVKVSHPYDIKKKETEAILFFTGGNSIIPGEIYSNFLNNLAAKNYAVYVSINDMDKSEIVADYLLENYKNLSVLGHSTGSINALKLCNELKEIKKCVFMDPVDNRFIDSDNDSKKKLQSKYLSNVLFLNARKSYEWTYTPFPNLPFIPAFRIKPKDLTIKKGTATTIEAKQYGHCDILDSTWGNFMHSTISKGVEDRDTEVLNNYQKWCATIIDMFLQTEKFKKTNIREVENSHNFKTIKYEYSH